MKSKKELLDELAALRAKRKPAPVKTEAQLAEEAECAKLMDELEAERKALRAQENAEIMAKHCPDKSFAFFDFDEDGLHPEFMEHNGRLCKVHTRFVVRGADGEIMRQVQNDEAVGGDVYERLRDVVHKSLVYPEPVKGEGSAQHYLDLLASFHRVGGTVPTMANHVMRLGGMHLAAHQSKS